MAAPAGSQQTFVSTLARLTGLNPQVIAAWVNVEGAYAPNGTGGYNFLNIREGTSRSGVPIAGTTSMGFAHFHSAQDAATETAYILNHSPAYRGVVKSANLTPQSQLAAIAASPWDAGHYNGGKTLYAAYNALSQGVGKILSTAGRVIGDATNPVAGAGDALGAIPGVKDIPVVGGVISAAEAPVKIAEDFTKVVEFIFNPTDWLRIGYILGGGILIVGGLLVMARSVGAVQSAAALAFPEGTLAAQAAGKGTSPAPKQRAPRTRTRTVYVTGEEENRRERVRRRAAAAQPSNDIPF